MHYSKQKQHYENLWKKVGNWDNESPNFKTRTPNQDIFKFIEFLKNKGVKGKALDIGCGGGRHLIPFAENGFESYGIDYSKTAIKLAQIYARQKNIKLNLKLGDILKLPYKKDYFDVVHDSGCSHHIKKKDWLKYTKNILKVLKKNGYYRLLAFSINTDYLMGYKVSKRGWIINKDHYIHFFKKKEITDFFSKYFKILKLYEIETKKGRFFYVAYMQKK